MKTRKIPVRESVKIEFNGQSMNAEAWSQITGIPAVTIRRRMHRGLPVSVALKPSVIKVGDKRSNPRTRDQLERQYPIGSTHSRLTVVGFDNSAGFFHLDCECLCGKRLCVRVDEIERGTTKSCGCLRKDNACKHLITHGNCSKPLYYTWRGMMARCYDERHPHFMNYGGRGISVCERWKNIDNFLTDMLPTNEAGLTLDRINNDLGYEPSNCRWATRKQQAQNKRNTRKKSLAPVQ